MVCSTNKISDQKDTSNNTANNSQVPVKPMIVLESSSTAKNTFNPIRNIVDNRKVQPNPEKSVISLSLGDPTVFGNLQTHEEVQKSVMMAVGEGKADGYLPVVGSSEARDAIAQRYRDRYGVNCEGKDVIVASGCSGALEMAFTVLCSPSESSILLPHPGFTLYTTLAASKSIKPLFYNLKAERNWEIDLGQVESVFREQNVKVWLINNPSNPCGSVYSREHLEDCLKLAKKYDVVIIADEIYEDMVFEGHEYIPMARLSQQKPELSVPILTCAGLAKRFLVPGWRVGWIVINQPLDRPDSFMNAIRRGLFDLAGLIIGANSLIQAAIPRIFAATPESFYTDTNKYLERNAALLVKTLSGIDGLKVIAPQGTLYAMVGLDFDKFHGFTDDVAFMEALLSEESVSCLPGSIFGMSGYIRIVFSAPPEILQEACDRIKSFLQRHRII